MFQYLPKIDYKINDHDTLKVIDITIYTKLKDFLDLYKKVRARPYFIQDGAPPDLVSNLLYGTPKYEYAILAFNNIFNVYDEWPRSYKVLNAYIEAKYGSIYTAQTTVAKYFDANGSIISEEAWNELIDPNKNTYLQTNYEYENELNNAKAKINVFSNELITNFEVELQKYLQDIT